MKLCLSGGGYRATLYHLGAARRLHELGILNRIDTISSVSGGSIFAAMLAALAIQEEWEHGLEIEDFDTQVAAPVHRLTARDIRTTSLLAWGSNASQLERLLDPYFHHKKLSDLPERPDFVFCATDLTHGSLFEFCRTHLGSSKFEAYDGPEERSIAFAVVASACFPPWFAPVKVKGRLLQSDRLKAPSSKQPSGDEEHETELSDGGLYDVLGLQHSMSSSAAQVLVSDASAPLDESRMPNTSIGRLMRYVSVTGRQARKLRLALFEEGIGRNDFDGACWDIGAYDGVQAAGSYRQELIDQCISLVRTDLDHFNKEERQVLENHGYWSVEDQLTRPEVQRRLAGCIGAHPPARAPHEAMMDEQAVRDALLESHRRRSVKRIARGMAVASAAKRYTRAESLRGARGQAG